MGVVSDLYHQHVGEDIFVLGTGPSARVFPLEFLQGKVSIGCNMAWKLFPTTYNLTMRPELNIPEFMEDHKATDDEKKMLWVVKYAKFRSDDQLQLAKNNPQRFFDFESGVYDPKTTKIVGGIYDHGRVTDWLRKPSGNNLYLWSSIAQSAANLAANLGAKNIILIGCDNAALGGNHHAHNQHIFFQTKKIQDSYDLYYEGIAEVRSVLRERGVNMFSMNPFLGVGHIEQDFMRLCKELDKPQFIENANLHAKNAKGIKQLLQRLF
jgi:hypothetical protein